MNHHPISQANKRQQQTQQQWIQQVAGNPRLERMTNKTPQDRERRLEIQGEQRHSEGKRCQLKTEDVKKQQQNGTITLQTKPTMRRNTDCRLFSKMRSIEFATKPTRNHREASLQSKLSVLRCNDRPRQQAFYTPSVRSTWGVSFQRTEDSQSAFSPSYSKVYFTMNSLEHR